MKNLYRLIFVITMAILLTGGNCGKEEPTPKKEPEKEVVKQDPPLITAPPKEDPPKEDPPKEKEPEKEVVKQEPPPPPPPPPPPDPPEEEPVVEETKPVEVEETVEAEKPAEVQKAVEEEEPAQVLAQQEEVEKEEAQIAEEQDAERSVEAPKAVTIISSPPEEPEAIIYDMGMVYFAYDKSVITASYGEIIQKNYEWIAENSDVQIQLEGHCDERGTNEYNLALGERRARAVLDYLVSLGASPSQFSLVSFGEERPAVEGSYESAWSKNRRVEFTRL